MINFLKNPNNNGNNLKKAIINQNSNTSFSNFKSPQLTLCVLKSILSIHKNEEHNISLVSFVNLAGRGKRELKLPDFVNKIYVY
jgi:hypothetical protein